MKNNNFRYKYIGCFIDRELLDRRISSIDRSILDNVVLFPHVTFAYKPDYYDADLFGEVVEIELTGYGNNGKNEGLSVKIITDNKRLKDMINSIAQPHITLSVSQNSEAVNTSYLSFEEIDVIRTIGVFGGLNSSTLKPVFSESTFLQYPTKKHESFIDYIREQSVHLSIDVLIKGSLSKGKAKVFSDIDIVMGALPIEDFRKVVFGYKDVFMSEHFSYSNTYMVIYKDGLCVEYDLRKSVLQEELDNGFLVNNYSFCISDVKHDRYSFGDNVIPFRNSAYSAMMVIYMCCCKSLCNKNELAYEIYHDRLLDSSFYDANYREKSLFNLLNNLLNIIHDRIELDYYIFLYNMLLLI